MSSPLRPELYKRIEGRLGPVRIVNEGEAFRGSVTWNAVTKRNELHMISPGEYYVTSCNFCNDTRQRLWINHRWGLYVPELKTDNLWLAICYNENCLSVSGRAWQLKQYLFNDFLNGRDPDIVLPGVVLPEDTIRQAQPPGRVISLDRLPQDHAARAYLRARGFDPAWLAQNYQVGYCLNAWEAFRHAHNRLIIPVLWNGHMVGWQARYVGEPPGKEIPKYWTMPGMRKSKLLYSFDVARTYPYVVVCEGMIDVWRFGPEAVAVFGKHASLEQRRLLAEHWRKGVVIILLDPDAESDANRLAESLELRDHNKVVVRLPEGKDPGDFPTPWLRDFVFRAAREQGFPVGIPDVSRDRQM